MGKTSRKEFQGKKKVEDEVLHDPAEGGAFLAFCNKNIDACRFVCFGGILFFYSYYAYLQEKLFSDKVNKLNVSLILCVQYSIAALISGIIIHQAGIKNGFRDSFTTGDLKVACFSFGAMNASNMAMAKVSFPLVVLSKSAKVIPVIIVGTLRGVYKPNLRKFVVAFFISLGLIVFNIEKLTKSKGGDEDKDFTTGILLVTLSLTFDGLTQTQTDMNHKQSKRDFAYQGMFCCNVVGAVLSAMMYYHAVDQSGEDAHTRILASDKLMFDTIMVGLSGSLGQVFVFFTISLFDCYLLTVLTTTRKFFSVVFSNFRFGHKFSQVQWLGSGIVMACTFVEMFLKKKAPPKDAKPKKE